MVWLESALSGVGWGCHQRSPIDATSQITGLNKVSPLPHPKRGIRAGKHDLTDTPHLTTSDCFLFSIYISEDISVVFFELGAVEQQRKQSGQDCGLSVTESFQSNTIKKWNQFLRNIIDTRW